MNTNMAGDNYFPKPAGDKRASPAQLYFSRSPFRDRAFLVSTAMVALVAIWGIIQMRVMEPVNSCIASVVLVLGLLPIGLWIYSLFLHWEIRNLAWSAEPLPSFSRLHLLHVGLPLTVASLMLSTIFAVVECSWRR